uniref:Reverse transcriptase domain-containing protein n=1 Tax=Peronospora matthiolae TaxID=2874970 RepID=A0AAV1T560_9STRA
MSRLGFPASFVHLTSALHTGTRSQFIVNGYMSDPLDVGCGIRQGCPLAPLLFIIAVEPLYEILHSTVKGVRIANTSETLEIKVCGYGDDTAVLWAVPLCAGVSIDPTLLHGVKLLQAGERRKTNTVRSRALLASALIIPRVTFLARHSWPTREVIDSLQLLVKRFVWGSRQGVPSRAWMSEAQAGLRVCDGGIAIPHVATELLAMAANAVGKWASFSNGPARVAGDILLARRAGVDVYLTPDKPCTTPKFFTVSDTMWASGAAVVRGVHSVPIDLSKAGCVAATESLLRRHISAAYWEGDTLTFRIDTATVQAIASKAVGEQCISGTFCHEWLARASAFTVTGNSACGLGPVQGDCVQLSHAFPSTALTIALDSETAKSIVFSINTIVYTSVPVQSRYDCELRARADINQRDFRFHDHPALSRLVQLHTGAIWRFKRARYKEAVSGQRVAQGTVERDRAIAVQATDNKDLHDALSQLDWRDIRAVKGAGASTVQTLFRLKANKLNLWNYVHSDRSCPHGECPRDVPISLQHVFWECPIAKAAWKDFDIRWRRLGDNVPANLIESCFSLDLDDTPTRAWRTGFVEADGGGDNSSHLVCATSSPPRTRCASIDIAGGNLRYSRQCLARFGFIEFYKFDTDISKLPKNAATRALADCLKGTIDGTILSPSIRDRSAYVLFLWRLAW